MPTRKATTAATNSKAHHLRQLARASTDRDRLWAACSWLVAEAARTGRAGEASRAVLCVVDALRHGQPATDRVFDSIFESTESATTGPPTRVGVGERASRAGARG